MQTLQRLARKIFGTQNDRELKSIEPLVSRINELEATISKLSDAQLQGKTVEFKTRYSKGETLDSLLPEAFAVVRETGKRVLNMRHFDVQMIGGITLHRGRIAEMRTGEGKTLVATLPSYLNALSGKGVHVVTVNDYLARRDAEWMGRIHRFLGLEVGIIVHGLNDSQRQQNYGADITYGTNNEFGFDYLRDNMKFRLEDYVQRDLNFAIVDEVDSILIDEARTPLIISGPTDDFSEEYYRINRELLRDGSLTAETDYTIDEKSKTASLTEAGVEKMEKRLGIANLYDPNHIETLHHVNQALRAHMLYKKDVDYVVRDNQVMIVDEFTGRLMPGRRWSDGLHQAIEAKEGVEIENENQTLATITFQNYFRMYNKLSGMTGTADTEATEFKQIYKLDVTVIPTNQNMIRKDHADVIYKNQSSKFKAIIDEIKKLHEKGQPILVGTISVEKSEILSQMLKAAGIKHNVLNAKQHQREAEIVAQAGRKGAVTIATNMAGRGTDILLGGNFERIAQNEIEAKEFETPEAKAKEYEEVLKKWKATYDSEKATVLESGGLFIIGTERHESRRIDNQLRGRAGRQGDPGESRFYLSLEDDLMRIFGRVNIARFMEEDLAIEHPLITKAILNAQKKVEAHNYDIRKHLLEYDDVMNQQRKVIYSLRRDVLSEEGLQEIIFSMIDEIAEAIANDFFPGGKPPRSNGARHIDMNELRDALDIQFNLKEDIQESEIDPFNDKGLKNLIVTKAEKLYQKRKAEFTETVQRQLEKMILLTTIDHLWKDHLLAMDHLRDGIGLRGYGQKDPLVEYKKEGFRFFKMMMNQITSDVVRKVFTVQVGSPDDTEWQAPRKVSRPMNLIKENPGSSFTPTGMPSGASEAPQNPMGSGPVGGFGAVPSGSPAGGPARGPVGFPGSAGIAGASNSGVERVGRNDPCPCGSGKKYKKCHGA